MSLYLLTISHDDVVNVLRTTPLSQIIRYPVLVEDVQKAARWFPEHLRKVLNGITLRRRIDDTEHLFEMLLYKLKDAQRKRSSVSYNHSHKQSSKDCI